MTREELEKVRAWADDKIAKGAEPPWAWYQYMKLRETLDAVLAGMEATAPITVPVDSQPEAQHRGSGHLRLVDTCPPDSAQRRPADEPVQLPM